MDGSQYETVQSALRGIICRLRVPQRCHEDLLQEALLRFLRVEQDRPTGHFNLSWRLNNCKRHLLHLTRDEREIELWIRSQAQAGFPHDDEDSEDSALLEASGSQESFLAALCAREEIALLLQKLSKMDRAIVAALGEGLRPAEIGRRLHLSHQAVAEHLKRISLLAANNQEPDAPSAR